MLSGFDNPIHLLFLFLVVLMLFGAKRLPEIGHGLGTGIRGFRDALTLPQHAIQQEAEAATTALHADTASPTDVTH